MRIQDPLPDTILSKNYFEHHVFRHVFDHAVDGYMILNEHFTIIYMNQTARKWFGDVSPNQLMRCSDLLHCHDDEGAALLERGCYGHCVLFSKTSLENVEMNVTSETGQIKHVSVSYSYIPDIQGEEKVILMSIRDITDSKKMELEQRKIAELEYTLRERERLARDLHDTIAQDMAYANMQLKVIAKCMEENEKQQMYESVRNVSAVLDECFVELRQTLRDLNFSGGDLQAFIQDTARTMEKRTGVHVDLQIQGNLNDLGDRIVTQTARLIQETMANIRKHANATKVEISVVLTDQQLKIKISDNGKGFVPENIDMKNHFGLRSIRERCESIQGKATLVTALEKGTTWIFEIDLELIS